MKLSDFQNEEALDLIGDIIEPASKILADTKVKQLFENEKNKLKLVKYLLKNHKKSILEILAILNGTPVEEYKANVAQIIKQVLDLLNDEELLQVFTLQSQEMTESTSFGSATANTEETEKK